MSLWAFENITVTFSRAVNRDLWGADDDMKERLQDISLSVEGDLEANMASVMTQAQSND